MAITLAAEASITRNGQRIRIDEFERDEKFFAV
jgi:hypothetical protein